MNEQLFIPQITIDLGLSSDGGTLEPTLAAADGYEMDEEGNIQLKKTIQMGGHGLIEFRIADSRIVRFAGLRITDQESKLPTAQTWLDSFELRLPETPFRVSSNASDVPTLLQLWTWPYIDNFEPEDNMWFYTVGVFRSAADRILWLDPRIHNKGDDVRSRARRLEEISRRR